MLLCLCIYFWESCPHGTGLVSSYSHAPQKSFGRREWRVSRRDCLRMVAVGTARRQLSPVEVEEVPWEEVPWNDRPMSWPLWWRVRVRRSRREWEDPSEVNCTFVKSNNGFTLILNSAFFKSLPISNIFDLKEKYWMNIYNKRNGR